MNESKEVAGRLLVPGRDPPVLLDQVDEPLGLLPFLVHMLVIIAAPSGSSSTGSRPRPPVAPPPPRPRHCHTPCRGCRRPPYCPGSAVRPARRPPLGPPSG